MSQQTKQCPFCGNFVNDEQNFCPNCGNNISKVAPYTQYGYDPYSPSVAPTQLSQPSQTPIPPPPPPPPVDKKKFPLGAILIALAVIVVIGSAIVFLQKRSASPKASTATPTKAAVNTVATATQTAAVTQTSAPFIPKGYSASLVMENSLGVPSAQWKESASTNKAAICGFEHGGYVVQAKTPNTYWDCEDAASGASYADLIFQVQMTVLSGDCGGLGIRDNGTNNYTGYQFLICSDNSYLFYKLDQQGNTTSLIKSTKVNLDATVNNKIVVVAYGDNFEMYVNGEKLFSKTDTTYQGAGAVGLVALDNTTSTQALFTNVKLWTLSA